MNINNIVKNTANEMLKDFKMPNIVAFKQTSNGVLKNASAKKNVKTHANTDIKKPDLAKIVIPKRISKIGLIESKKSIYSSPFSSVDLDIGLYIVTYQDFFCLFLNNVYFTCAMYCMSPSLLLQQLSKIYLL
jgi:hypothetical protein